MPNEIEVMRVLRVPPMSKLVVAVNKQRYEKLSEVPEENVKQLLLAAIGELIVFAGGYQNLVDAGMAPPVTPATQTNASLEEQRAAFLADLEEEQNRLKTSSSSRGRGSLAGGLQQPAQVNVDKTLSIVEQIDAIVQRYVDANPDLAGRSIHLEQNPEGGLRIRVDNTYYQRPREIEDAKIQQLIQKALKEWESS